MSTKIEWTDTVWNPTTGCAKMSAGCKNCYAEKMTKRLAAMGQQKYQGILTPAGRFNGTVRTHEDTLRIPFTWRKPRKVFVNSMSDLFHADVPFAFIDRVFAVMMSTPQHTYQILTKRPDRMLAWFNHKDDIWKNEGMRGPERIRYQAYNEFGRDIPYNEGRYWPLPNVWLGTSVENQAAADERIPHLLRCPAAVRFLSCEPLLGPVDIGFELDIISVDGKRIPEQDKPGSGTMIHWVIAGGESGPNARPMHPDWARGLRDQCRAAGVAFFFKQWGEWDPDNKRRTRGQKLGFISPCGHFIEQFSDNLTGVPYASISKVGKKAAGRTLDGRTHVEFPNRSAPPLLLPNEQHLSSCRTNYLP